MDLSKRYLSTSIPLSRHVSQKNSIRLLRLAVLLGAVALCCSCSGPQEHRHQKPLRHVILLTIDTLRADHFLATKGGIRLTPMIDQFAERSFIFTSATSVAAETSPGVAGILSGLFPNRNAVIINDHILPRGVPTIATLLGENNFLCGAFVANPVLKSGYGFEHGFDYYEFVQPRPPYRKTKADDLNRAVLDWLQAVESSERLFLWVHYMDPHGPYEPIAEVARLFDADAFDAPRDIPLLGEGKQSGWGGIPEYQQSGVFKPTSDGRDYLLRYAAEVRFLDAQIARLLSELEDLEILKDAILIIASDHGEALINDHGFYFSHDNGLTLDQVSTPLLLHIPGCTESTRINRAVSNVDIFPTICAFAQVKPPDEIAGSHLLDENPRLVISQSGREKAIRREHMKLRFVMEDQRFMLYDLSTDPGETADIQEALPGEFEDLRQILITETSRPPIEEPTRRQHLQDEIAGLKALGYIVD